MSAVQQATHAFDRETRPHDCWDWVTPERVTSLALWAFQRSQRSCFPDKGCRFVDPADGVTWASRGNFAETLAELLEMAIKAEAHSLGIEVEEFAQHAERYLLWRRDERREVPL